MEKGNSLAKGLLLSLLTALAYVLATGAAHALPNINTPGEMSPLWPPAGIALAALILYGPRVLPGILLGVFFSAGLNHGIPSGERIGEFLLEYIGHAFASALQAWVGYVLLRRFVTQPLSLNLESDILKFAALGALGCLTAPSIGTASLLMGGDIALAEAHRLWFTWWIGDALGVLLITPMVLAFLGKPAGHWRPRRLTLALPLTVAMVLVIGSVYFLDDQDRLRAEQIFQQKAVSAGLMFDHHIKEVLKHLRLRKALEPGEYEKHRHTQEQAHRQHEHGQQAGPRAHKRAHGPGATAPG